MASPTSCPVVIRRNWADLPPDLISSILHKLDAIEILQNAQKVCRSWRRVCKDPSMWRKIHMPKHGYYIHEKMFLQAVDLSQGDCTEISIWYFGTDNLLNYIANSSSNLRSLKLAMCYITSKVIMEAVMKLPVLEELEVTNLSLPSESLKVVDHKSCPNLKTLKINSLHYSRRLPESDGFALTIAETMPGLRHLQLFGNRLTNVGLNAILDNCPDLEHLDLRQCFKLDLVGDLKKRCLERIKVVRFPNDSISDYPYESMVYDLDSVEDDCYYYEDIIVSDDDEF